MSFWSRKTIIGSFIINRLSRILRLLFMMMPVFLVCYCCFVFFSDPSVGEQSLDMTGQGWSVHSKDSNSDGHGDITVPAIVPGDVFLDLLRAKKISDPYVGQNDVNLRWVGMRNWSYTKLVTLEEKQLQKPSIILIAKGLDTVAAIYINGNLVATCANMFREWAFDIKSKLNRGTNRLEISFLSPQKYALNQSEIYQKIHGYAVPPDGHSPIENGINHVNFIRKMQSSFSWDWGPGFGTMGIWKNISIVPVEKCYLDKISGVTSLDKNTKKWSVHTELFVWCAYSGITVHSTIEISELKSNVKISYSKLPKGWNRLYAKVDIPETVSLELWWPNGYGAQKLYQIHAVLTADTDSTLHKTSSFVGFRHIELVQENINDSFPSQGLTFYFRVNSIPIFLKGSNWIPGDSFLSRLTKDKLDFYFTSMAKTHTNAIRVWGGGVYESDYFYDLADKHGILIWQDMMFAVALYPTDGPYLQSVAAELRDQIDRLKHHPSILVWAGNNENELGLRSEWYSASGPMAEWPKYKNDYLKLYNSTIWGVINETDFNNRPYLMSSPSNGVDSLREGGVANAPNDYQFGDVHFYDYSNNAWSAASYPIVRCATEYGYQSLPSKQTLQPVIGVDASNWSYFSAALLHRQHHPIGTLGILAQVLQHFKIPGCVKQPAVETEEAFNAVCSQNHDPKFLDSMIYLSQAFQAIAYQTQTEHYRRWRNRTEEGLGQTMCALYWQLNDIWQAPTWSTIDYGLRWKMAQYYSKKFFAPVIVSPYIENFNKLIVAIVSDLPQPINRATLVIEAISWQSWTKPVFSAEIAIKQVPPFSSIIAYSTNLDEIGIDNVNEFIFRVRLINKSEDNLAPENVLLPNLLLDVPVERFGNVSIISVTSVSKGIFSVTLKANGLSPFVWLEVKNIIGYFSDNGFTMTRSSQIVKFYVWDSTVTLIRFKKSLNIQTLRDLY